MTRSSIKWIICLINYWIIGRLGNANALVMRGLEGPTEVVNRGEDIFLYCRYDLEQNDRLYAVKWFHGAREFYRFQPEMNPPGRVFPIEHIDVDVESSDAEKLVIRQVVAATSGIYRCEVSAEETFETDYREMNITIADTPVGNPVIYNVQSRYAVGDELRINCTLYDVHRPIRLYWLLNGHPMKELDGDEVKHYPSSETASPLLGLHIKRLTLDHFSHGQMTIACCAVTSSSHHRSGSVTEAKAFIRTELGATTTTTTTTSGVGGDQRQPLVNRLRPAVSTTATGDKRRSTQQSPTGRSESLAPSWIVILFTAITTYR